MRALVGIDPLHPGILDAEFFFQQRDFLTKTATFRFESDAGISTVDSPTAGVHGRVLDQTDDMQHCGTHVAGPWFRQRNLRFPIC